MAAGILEHNLNRRPEEHSVEYSDIHSELILETKSNQNWMTVPKWHLRYLEIRDVRIGCLLGETMPVVSA